MLGLELGLDFDQQLVDDSLDRDRIQRRELDHGVEAVAKLWRKQALDRLHAVAGVVLLGETDGRARHILRPGVGGHHDDDMTKIRLATVVVGERAVIHDLQQQIEHIRMGFLHLVEQQYRVRMLRDRFRQQPALIEADVSGRSTDQARDGVAFHVFGHVEPNELDAERDRELPRHLGLAHAGGAREQEISYRFALIAEARARHFDRRGQRLDGLVLTEDHELQVALEVAQDFLVVVRDGGGRNSRNARHDLFNMPHFHGGLTLGNRLEPHP